MTSSSQEVGYFRYPAIYGDQVVFVSEDDLWMVPLSGGVARRLTGAEGQAAYPAFSPCGQWLAYTSTEQGCPEVFVMPSRGGPSKKITFSGARLADVVGFSPDGQSVIFASNLREPFLRMRALYSVPREGGPVERLSIGQARRLSYQPDGDGRVLARYSDDLARWKRYRGGMAGQLWIDGGDGVWEELFADERAGLCRPMWIGDRIYFVSDRDGCGNLYSCAVDGSDLTQHTHHEDHFVRWASHHDATVVYTCGGALYAYDISSGETALIEVDYVSPQVELKSRFVEAADFVEEYTLHPRGHSLSVIARGKAFNFGNWEGAVRQTGEMQGVRYRLATYLGDGERLLVISDASGEERFEIHDVDGDQPVVEVDTGDFDIGRPIEMVLSPVKDAVLFTNHRHEVIHLDVESGECALLDRSPYDRIAGVAFSPDGEWGAYGFYNGHSRSRIRLVELATGEVHDVTSGDFQDVQPAFDPEGRYLYFLSYRHFDPVHDAHFFELSFPRGMKPCAITLSADEDSPFLQRPRPLEGDDDGDEGVENSDGESEGDEADEGDGEDKPEKLRVDLDGIQERLEFFPVPEGNYGDIAATSDRVLWTVYPVSGSLSGESTGTLQAYSLKKQKVETITSGVGSFTLDLRCRTLAVEVDADLWVISASADSVDEDAEKADRESGLIDLDRISVQVEPRQEWAQMLREAWRLMRDHFWREDMGGVDWDDVWVRYRRLLDRVSCRSEFSDMVWTMQGELGTSHAYELGGDYRDPPQVQPGFLGAELHYRPDWKLQDEPDRFSGAYEVGEILRGDPWDAHQSSPLLRPGSQVREGDVVLAINGQALTRTRAPGELLANQAGRQVELLVADGDGKAPPRTITVRTLTDETRLRYREWVALNRRTVDHLTGGRVGYVHVPDMGPGGYSEFHRQFLTASHREALIVDVRFNGGGYVSQLLLEKLARKPLGYELQRWGQPMPYPANALMGPLVALTNEEAGSDGDVFSHCFKLMELGPLIGRRTWGGVIGIFPRHALVDGSVTTQPEFSFWLKDVGYDLENQGVEPDQEVSFPPEARPGEGDPQLLAAVDEVMERLSDAKVLRPPES